GNGRRKDSRAGRAQGFALEDGRQDGQRGGEIPYARRPRTALRRSSDIEKPDSRPGLGAVFRHSVALAASMTALTFSEPTWSAMRSATCLVAATSVSRSSGVGVL